MDQSAGTQVADAAGNLSSAQVTLRAALPNGVWQPTGGVDGRGALDLTQSASFEIPINWQPTAFTVSWWVKPARLFDFSQYSQAGASGFFFNSNSAGHIYVGTDEMSSYIELTGGQLVQLNEWQHFVFTFDNGSGKFYKNGRLLASQPGMALPAPWAQFTLGLTDDALYDDLRFYNRAVSGQEAADLYTCLVPAEATCSATGSILREQWNNTTGNEVANIPLLTPPTSSSQLTSLELPTDAANNYGTRLRGYLCPPRDGLYTFWIAGDDQSELWLSSNDDPASKVKIASVSEWTSPRQWDKFAAQQSAPLTLVAGRRYYIEVLHIEGTGGDNLAVAWQRPGSTGKEIIPGSRLSPYQGAPTTNVPPANPNPNLERNWSMTRTFDGQGNVIGESKSFADALGRPTQAQVKSQTTQHVLATQTIYSSGGKPLLSTLAAPTNNSDFSYKENFLTSNGTPYQWVDFEGDKANNPSPVDQPATPGSVGYYYSDKNTLEPLTATTAYPFSLTQEYGGPLGGVKRATGPGDQFRMGLGRESKGREFPLLNELDHYLSLRPHFVPGSSAVTSLRLRGEKAVSINVDGKESITFTDADGKLLATCLSGAQYPALTLTAAIHADPSNAEGLPEYQDIHVPAAGPVTLSVTGTGAIRVVNLLTETVTSYATPWATITLDPGFYRVLSERDNQALSYVARYGDFSYSYYDDAGRVVATIAPRGTNRLRTPAGQSPSVNKVRNSSFEQDGGRVQEISSWQSEGNVMADYTDKLFEMDGHPNIGAHSGTYFGLHNSNLNGHHVITSQLVADLPNGFYTLRAWVRYNRRSVTATMFVRNFGAPRIDKLIPFSGNSVSGAWVLIEIPEIQVSNGQCEVGFESRVPAGSPIHLHFDDVELVSETSPQFVTRNTYSGAGTLVATESPDEGKTEYVYARDGRIRFSQSALQKQQNRFSYSNYDEVGRVVESGEYQMASGQGQVFENQVGEKTPATNSVLNLLEERMPTNSLDVARCAQRNQVWYDLPLEDAVLNGRTQEFVLGAVAKTTNGTNTTWYSYDELGRVTWLVQQIPGVGIKTVDYTYDFTGNVLEVAYQKGQPDAFYHHYQYDADQRLSRVYTSPDGLTKTQQAKYTYYLHGPLKRVEVADRLQGIDYAYTVQGWLKSINNVEGKFDPGQDSPTANGVLKDLFALRLDYFDGDYRSKQLTAPNLTSPANQNEIRYDGTVRASTWRTAAAPTVHGYAYRYDAKGQLLQSDYGQLTGGNSLSYDPATHKFEEGNLSYDAHGNILSLRRRDGVGFATDDFAYQYTANTNKLAAVRNQAGANVLSYEYDLNGQMTREAEAGKANKYLRYDVTGKVTGVYRNADFTGPVATYAYDDRGFRSSKVVYSAQGTAQNTTYYVTDAQGNVLSTYEQPAGKTLERTEVPLYGSGRVGTLTRLDDGTLDARYELNDQLGNARVIFHKPQTVTYQATMEPGQAEREEEEFTHVATTRFAYAGAAYDGTHVARLNASQGLRQGPSKTFTVEKGDTVTFSAAAFYQGTSGIAPQQSMMLVAGALATPPPSTLLPPTSEGKGTPRRKASRLPQGLGIGLAYAGVSTMQQQTTGSVTAWLHSRLVKADGTVLDEQFAYLPAGVPDAWQLLKLGLRVPETGNLELSIISEAFDQDVFFDHVEIAHTGSTIVQEQHQYAFGSPLTGLNYTVGNKVYRHGYQGQFAEKDAETGYDSFELRLYNSRIGRWTSYDPYGQYASPYVGMGNNPVSGTDPDGGWSYLASAAVGAVVGAGVGGYLGYQQGGREGMWGGMAMGAVAGGMVGGLTHWGVDNLSVSPTVGAMAAQSGARVGLDAVSVANLIKYPGEPDSYFFGTPVFGTTVGEMKNRAAMTLPGIGIFVNPVDLDNTHLLRHEYGHILQARKWGKKFFYGTIVNASIESAKIANSNPSFNHQGTWTEWTANYLSYRYFKSPKDWRFRRYPIGPPDLLRPGALPPIRPSKLYMNLEIIK